MGALNSGNQNLTFDFKHKAKGQEFNRILHQSIFPGVYDGFLIDANLPTTGKIRVQPGTLWIQDKGGKDVSVRCRTFSNITLPLSGVLLANKIYYVIARFEWFNVTDNWVDFLALDSSIPFILEAKDVILGTVTVNNLGSISVVSYDARTFGLTIDSLNSRFTSPKFSKMITVARADSNSNVQNGGVLNLGSDSSGPLNVTVFPNAGTPAIYFEFESPVQSSNISYNANLILKLRYMMSAAIASQNVMLTAKIYRDTALIATRSITFTPDNTAAEQVLTTTVNDIHIKGTERANGSMFTIELSRDNTVITNHSGNLKLISVEAKT